LISGLELCRSLGIDFVSITEAVDTSVPAGEMLFQMIYKRACQEHFSLFAGARVNSRHPVPLTMEDGCRGLGLFHLSSSIFFGRDDADQFRNESSRAVVRCQPWIYLRLLA